MSLRPPTMPLRYWQSCPVCGSTDIEGHEIDVQGVEVHQQLGCLNCDAEWVEVYYAAFKRVTMWPGIGVERLEAEVIS